MNALVTESLEGAAPELSPRAAFRERLRAVGVLYEPPAPPTPALSRDEAIARTRGAGRAVLDALEAVRSAERAGRIADGAAPRARSASRFCDARKSVRKVLAEAASL